MGAKIARSASAAAGRRPGPIYDDAMKILADDDLDAVLSLVGVGAGALEMDTELPGSAMRVDVLARSPRGIVHVEFVKDPAPSLDLRMMTYRLRIRSQDTNRDTPIAQYVLVLGDDIAVPDRYHDVDAEPPVFSWSVVRLADLDPAPLLANPTTAALAALARGTPAERAAVFTAAARLIGGTVPDRTRTLLEAATTLASIVLPAAIIDTALKEASMPVLIRDTPLGREIYQEGLAEGRQEGRQEGERQAVLRLTHLLLTQRFGDDPQAAAVAERLAELPDADRLTRIAAATSLNDLTT